LSPTTNVKPVVTVAPDWWDGRRPNSFFPAVYRRGDASREGFLLDAELSPEARTARECDLIQRYLSPSPGSAILDCPCGYGRHSSELARRGFKVTGVDLCPVFLAEAQTAAANLEPPGHCLIVPGDMRALPLPDGPFDFCLNLFLSFGFFDEAGNKQTLSEFARVLKPGGRLLIHTDVNPVQAFAGTYADRYHRSLADGGTLEIHEVYDASIRRLVGTWTLVENPPSKGTLTRGYSIRVYSREELTVMLQSTGFLPPQVIPIDSTGHAAGEADAQEVIYIATRG